MQNWRWNSWIEKNIFCIEFNVGPTNKTETFVFVEETARKTNMPARSRVRKFSSHRIFLQRVKYRFSKEENSHCVEKSWCEQLSFKFLQQRIFSKTCQNTSFWKWNLHDVVSQVDFIVFICQNFNLLWVFHENFVKMRKWKFIPTQFSLSCSTHRSESRRQTTLRWFVEQLQSTYPTGR